MTELASPVFGDFEIERREDGSLCELGRGAMGVTYRALSIPSSTVAGSAEGNRTRRPPSPTPKAMRERFLREARAAAVLGAPECRRCFFNSRPAAGNQPLLLCDGAGGRV